MAQTYGNHYLSLSGATQRIQAFFENCDQANTTYVIHSVLFMITLFEVINLIRKADMTLSHNILHSINVLSFLFYLIYISLSISNFIWCLHHVI